jgi:hypothetical protein
MKMADGDNAELIAAQAKVAELDAKSTALEADKVKLEGMHTADQTQIAKNGTELGDARKELTTAKEEIEALKASQVPPKPEPTPKVETADEIEASLEDGQKAAVQEVWATLTDEKKLQFKNDEKYRKDFLLEAKKQIQPVPESPWVKPKESKITGGEELNGSIADMFKQHKERNGFQPSGPASGRNSATGRGGSASPSNEPSSAKDKGILGPYGK